ncbi:circadian clock protein KaiC [Sulfitobacter sp. S190]|uniref:circadian clock protein KaiC n=1 Tax=Sulfitobacter sp. S190 TaxID=2867022 RepID=UPI0021A4F179|nr:circadian clock protein KaiC [Sulfitobacter sp. S190]UWR21270.1 circadian clock protein KaiC [Sulfitobacter sp. S190]
MNKIEQFTTGISGFDQLSGGGLPRGRTTVITGGAGCGKTLFMLSILANAALTAGSPAVFMSFEERPEAIIKNAASIGLDLQALIDKGLFRIDYVAQTRDATTEVGNYTLDGLRMRIKLALKATNARLLALDTVETLFAMFEDERAIRGELVHLFNTLSDEGVTTLMSAEQGDGRLTRHGFEEYVADAVIVLENDTIGDTATRRMRIVKFRGAHHGPNKYPFLIDEKGLTIAPLTSALFDHKVSTDRVSTGLMALDDALDGGVRVGSTLLLTGSTGTCKTILAAKAAEATCARGDTVLYLSFEESPQELMENVGSAGVDLQKFHDDGHLIITSARPTLMGLERHLVELYRRVDEHQPSLVVLDPVSSLATAGDRDAVYRTIVRMIDYLKRLAITTVITLEPSEVNDPDRAIAFSSILDTLIELSFIVTDEGVERSLQIIKARGTAHDHRKLLFAVGNRGLKLETDDG